MTKWWWSAPKLAPIVIALSLAAVLPSSALAQTAPAAGDSAAAAPAPVDPQVAKAQEEARRKEIADKEKADQKAKELAAIKDARTAGIPWFKGADWMSFKVGVSGSKVENSPGAGPAVGFGAQHFQGSRWSLGMNVDLDVLGRFGGANEMELPLTLEAQRHFRWGTDSFRPFVGFGTGLWYHRFYRTGADGTQVRPGFLFSGGFNSPISGTALIGMTARLTVQNKAESDNPYFPNDSNSAVHWSLKLSYIRVR